MKESAFSPTQIAAAFLGLVFIDIGHEASLAQPAAHPALAWLSLAAYALGFAALILAVKRGRRLDEWTAAGFMLAFVLHVAVRTVAQPLAVQYGTDALAFNHYSALLLLHGSNPYASSMEPAYRLFSVPASVYTPTTHGGLVVSQSYPALSFLLYVPFAFMHLRSMLFVDVAFAALSMLLVAFLMPPGRKALALLVFFASAEYFDFVVGSVTDVTWLPFMILVAAFWEAESPIAAVALGLACATKQDPWFVVPFALVHWYHLRDRVPMLRNTGAAALAFLLPNLAFIIWNPAAWLHGVFFPMISGAVPTGSGIVLFITSNVLPFPVQWLTWTWPAVLVAGVAFYAWRHRGLAWMPFVWPAVVLFFSPRSLQNYFIYWPIALVVYLLVPTEAAPEAAARARAPWTKRTAIAFAAASACVIAVAVLTTTASLRSLAEARISGAAFDSSTGLVRALDVEMNERGDTRSSYRFAVDSAKNGAIFWRVARVTRESADRVSVRLEAPGLGAEVPVSENAGVQVAAYAPNGDLVAYTSSWMPQADPQATLSNLHLICARSAFTFLPAAAPLMWEYSASDLLGGTIACAPRGSADSAVLFNVRRPHDQAWRLATIVRLAEIGSGRFSFWLKPGSDSTASVLPTHVFGVSLVDGLNHQYYVMTNSRIRSPEFLTRDRFRYYIVPAKLHAWTHVSVDARALPGFYVPPYGTIQVIVMDAIHTGDAVRVTDDEFGGFGSRP
ncbi:MAG TPA: hypothetical protein VIN40_04510 [Candidatus Tyrphobacter sp.]